MKDGCLPKVLLLSEFAGGKGRRVDKMKSKRVAALTHTSFNKEYGTE